MNFGHILHQWVYLQTQIADFNKIHAVYNFMFIKWFVRFIHINDDCPFCILKRLYTCCCWVLSSKSNLYQKIKSIKNISYFSNKNIECQTSQIKKLNDVVH